MDKEKLIYLLAREIFVSETIATDEIIVAERNRFNIMLNDAKKIYQWYCKPSFRCIREYLNKAKEMVRKEEINVETFKSKTTEKVTPEQIISPTPGIRIHEGINTKKVK